MSASMIHRKRDKADGEGGSSRGKPGAKPFGGKQAAGKPAPKGKHTSVKNQIRAVTRLLNKGQLEPKAAAAQQKRLQELRDSLVDNKTSEKTRRYAIKYHKVRFFERVKLERRIQKLEKQPLSEGDAAAEERRTAQLAALRDDLLYVTHFPKEEKYVSILKSPDDPVAASQVAVEVARLRAMVHARAQDAALVADSDEGRSLAHPSAAFQRSKENADNELDDFFLGEGAALPGEGEGGGADEAAAQQGAKLRDAWAPDRQAASSGGGFGGKQKQARREGASTAKPPKEPHAKLKSQRQLQQQQQQQQQQHNRLVGKASGQQLHSRAAALVPKRSFFAANGPGAAVVNKQPQHHRTQPQHDASSHARLTVAHPQAPRGARPAAANAAAGAAVAKPTGRTRAEGGRKRRKK